MVQEGKQRMNDTNTDSDGPTWIQTATGGDKPRTAGGTPTTDSLTNLRATERSEGGRRNMSRRPTPEFTRNRKQVLADNPMCHWCKRVAATDADHLVPYDAGGSDELDNLVPACKSCNSKRGASYVNQKRAIQQQRRNEELNIVTGKQIGRAHV